MLKKHLGLTVDEHLEAAYLIYEASRIGNRLLDILGRVLRAREVDRCLRWAMSGGGLGLLRSALENRWFAAHCSCDVHGLRTDAPYYGREAIVRKWWEDRERLRARSEA
jgi:hypothetical protein